MPPKNLMNMNPKLTKQYLRTSMPQTARTVDLYRSVFSVGIKVLWAKEGDFEVGKIPETKNVVIAYDPEFEPT